MGKHYFSEDWTQGERQAHHGHDLGITHRSLENLHGLNSHSTQGLDNDPTLSWLGSTVTGVSDPEATPAQPVDPWVTMGAKPKIIAISTLYHAQVKMRSPQGGRTVTALTTLCKQEQWIVASTDKHRSLLPCAVCCHVPSPEVQQGLYARVCWLHSGYFDGLWQFFYLWGF